jgi:hypothetical protein
MGAAEERKREPHRIRLFGEELLGFSEERELWAVHVFWELPFGDAAAFLFQLTKRIQLRRRIARRCLRQRVVSTPRMSYLRGFDL